MKGNSNSNLSIGGISKILHVVKRSGKKYSNMLNARECKSYFVANVPNGCLAQISSFIEDLQPRSTRSVMEKGSNRSIH